MLFLYSLTSSHAIPRRRLHFPPVSYKDVALLVISHTLPKALLRYLCIRGQETNLELRNFDLSIFKSLFRTFPVLNWTCEHVINPIHEMTLLTRASEWNARIGGRNGMDSSCSRMPAAAVHQGRDTGRGSSSPFHRDAGALF